MRTCTAVLAALAMYASAAQADIVALTSNNTLAMIDSKSAKVTGTMEIQGLEPVLGIDVRPSDGMLYALAADGTVATINLADGKATVKSKLGIMPPPAVKVTVDFNPVSDRLRIVGSDGTNLRANVDDGVVAEDQTLTFAKNDAASGEVPMIVAGSYTNSVKGARETTLYDIDGGLYGLFRQVPPNDGLLNTVGALGIDVKHASFDIMTDATGTNTALLVVGQTLYSVDLAGGKAIEGKPISGLPGDVRDIAALRGMEPEGM